MKTRRIPLKLLIVAATAALLAWATPAAATDPSRTHVLVAKPQLTDPSYRATVVLVRPMGEDQHVGVILNRPTKMTLGQLFPEHPASQKVPDPVFVGGPMSASVLFAIVKSKARPGGKLLQLLPDVYMAFDSDTVDRIIEGGGQARYLAGLVAWQPGELRSELRRGAWYIMEADPALVTRKPDGMWEELLRRAELRDKAI